MLVATAQTATSTPMRDLQILDEVLFEKVTAKHTVCITYHGCGWTHICIVLTFYCVVLCCDVI